MTEKDFDKENKMMEDRFIEGKECFVCGKSDASHTTAACIVCGGSCCPFDCSEYDYNYEKVLKFVFIEGYICKKCHPNMLRKFPPDSQARKILELYTCRYQQGHYDGQNDGLWRGWKLAEDPGYKDEWLEEGGELPPDFGDDVYDRFPKTTLPLEYK
jgi:hypothetical protein